MTATQRSTTVSFKATGITSITDVSVTEQTVGQAVNHTDAAAAAQAVHTDGVHLSIAVTTTDVTTRAGFDVGETGALVVTRKDRANGSGDGVGTQVETYAEATLVGYSDNAGTGGTASLTMNFIASSSDGTIAALVVYS